MEHITVGRKYNKGKAAFVECQNKGPLNNIDIKNKCFLLIVLTSGRLTFKLSNETVIAAAPCFICFDECEEPRLLSKAHAEYFCIYFNPNFLNVNMTFELVRSKDYGDIADTHDMFLLKPFIDGHHVISISENYLEHIDYSCRHMEEELREQRDWYWSCRGRSYFMEIIIALERMYGLIGYGNDEKKHNSVPTIKNDRLRAALLFIEAHYADELVLSDISRAAGLNHTTLTRLLKQEMGITAMEYLMQFRIKVAKKHLAFTEVPIKDIVHRTGFKTIQHFGRVFKAHTGQTPADFRKTAVQKRKDEIK